MQGHQMRSAIPFAQSLGHAARISRCASLSTGRSPPRIQTNASDSDPQPAAVGGGVLRREDLRTHTPFLIPFVPPRRQHADDQTQLIRLADDLVHVFQIVILRTIVDFGPRGIVVRQRRVAVGIGIAQAVQFGQDNGLDDGEALGGPYSR